MPYKSAIASVVCILVVLTFVSWTNNMVTVVSADVI